MFTQWLNENRLSEFDFSKRLFPPAADRTFWQDVIGDSHICRAEKYLGYEWPLIRATQFMEFQKSGNRIVQEDPHFARRKALITLIMGELAEYKGRFLPDICDGVFLICEETFWGLSAHYTLVKRGQLIPDADDPYIDLFSAETAELLSVVYHIFYEELAAFCPPLVHRIEYELDRRIVTPYLNRGDFAWMGNITGRRVNNWNPWILSNVLTVFALSGQRRSTLESGLKKMFKEIDCYYDGIPADGGCDEGTSYWRKAGAKLFDFCNVLYMITDGKIDFFQDEKLKNIGLYPVKTHISACSFVNFSDGNATLPNLNMDYSLYGFTLRTGDPVYAQMAATLKRNQHRTAESEIVRGASIKEELFSVIYAKEIDAQPEWIPAEKYYLPDLQNAFMRSGEWYYAAKGGHNAECHNHNDVGSLIVYHRGMPVLVDPGCGIYTRFTFSELRYTIWTMQSGWHNLPVLNGTEQLAGAEYRADGFAINDKKTEISFAGAYPREAGVLCVGRKVEFVEDGLRIRDAFVFVQEQNTVEEHLVTPLKPELTPQGVVLDGRYLIRTDLPVEIQWKDFEGDSKLKGAWGTEGLYRLTLKASCGKNASYTIELRSV